jgi:hypothetical protein
MKHVGLKVSPTLRKLDYTGGYWALVTLDIVPDSRGQSYKDCLKLVQNSGYSPTNMYELLLTIITYYRLTGRKLLAGEFRYGVEEKDSVLDHTLSLCEESYHRGQEEYRGICGCFEGQNDILTEFFNHAGAWEIKGYVGMVAVKRFDAACKEVQGWSPEIAVGQSSLFESRII